MESNLNKLAEELYKKIIVQFSDVEIANEYAEKLTKEQDIPLARFFEFEYQESGVPYGTVSINLDQEDGLTMQLSGDLANKRRAVIKQHIFDFIYSLRSFAQRHLIKFTVRNIGKRNLDQRDYSFQAKRKESIPSIMENKLYGSRKVSYQNIGETRLVVKHTQLINDSHIASRSQHIHSIFIETAAGERFKYPIKHLNGARALAEHINHGGTLYDNIGRYIVGLSEELAHLRKFKNYVGRQEQISESMGVISDRVTERANDIKRHISQLQRPAFYKQFVESFVESPSVTVPDAVLNDWVDRLTIRTFNEELKTAFPYIYRLLDENELPIKSLAPDDLSNTAELDRKTQQLTNSKSRRSSKRASLESKFESFVESITTNRTGIFDPDPAARNASIDKLNVLLSNDLLAGVDGINARNNLRGIIDDPAFLDSLRHIHPDLDVRSLIQQYISETAPALAYELSFDASDKSTEPQASTPPESELPVSEPSKTEPAPQQPVAEEFSSLRGQSFKSRTHPKFSFSNHRKFALKNILKRAQRAGATLETAMDIGPETYTIEDVILNCGFTLEECGFSQKNGVDEILDFIEGFWNNEQQNFTIGGTRVKTKITKEFEDGRFKNASPQDLQLVFKIIDQRDPGNNDHNQIMRLANVSQNVPQSIYSNSKQAEELAEIIADMNESATETMKRLINKINLRD